MFVVVDLLSIIRVLDESGGENDDASLILVDVIRKPVRNSHRHH